jgi:hypothetical protein
MLAPTQALVTERRALAALCDSVEPWQRLAACAAEPNVFHEPDFALAAAPVLGRDVEAILVWSADLPRRLVGLFPFRVTARRYGVKLPMLEGWTHPFAPLGTPLVDRDGVPAVVASFLDHVAGDAVLPKLLMLPLLDESGPVARALRTTVEGSGGAHAGFGGIDAQRCGRTAMPRITSCARSEKSATRNSSACAAASPKPARSHSSWRAARPPWQRRCRTFLRSKRRAGRAPLAPR